MKRFECVRFPLLERDKKTTRTRKVDIGRLSSLPDELLIHILSMVDIKRAVQTSMLLSRTNLWTMLPNLNFDLECLQPSAFSDNFLDKVLTLHRGSIQNVHISVSRTGQPDFKFAKRILTHALAHKVQHLSLNLDRYDVLVSLFSDKSWHWSSIFPDATESDLLPYDSLLSLTVKCEEIFFSRPNSVNLKTPYFELLTTLHLEKPSIDDSEFLLSCPNLQDLKMVHCRYSKVPPELTVFAGELSRLVLSYRESSVMHVKLVLKTPKLRHVKLEGPHSLFLADDDTLSLLENVEINFLSLSPLKEHHEILVDMLECFHTAKSVTLKWNTIELLSMFPDLLAKRSSPFDKLESLRVIKSGWSKSFHKPIPAQVKTYLLNNSSSVKVIQ